jgi:hypothetical protein
MASYKRLIFKNHPSIARELVKFLAINTSFEAIGKLTTKAAYLELKVVAYKKQMAAAVKSAASVANKADEAKKTSDLLTKRLTKLERTRSLVDEVQQGPSCLGTQLLFPKLHVPQTT